MKVKHWFIILISILIIITVLFIPVIRQNPSYHLFSDQRILLGIPNFSNVMSNILFLIVGFLGIVLIQKNNATIVKNIKLSYLVFFIGVFLVALGSSYYHLNPSNQTLVWDRLPMTIAFMAFFSIIIAEFISIKSGKNLFFPLVSIGLISIFYWDYTEHHGVGDLRLYALVQFLPMLLIPAILLLFRSCFSHVRYYWYFLGLYGLAKITETYDSNIYDYLFFISGHSIKHILASFGCMIFYYQVKNRHKLQI